LTLLEGASNGRRLPAGGYVFRPPFTLRLRELSTAGSADRHTVGFIFPTLPDSDYLEVI
jgi:hypothetical protein